MFILDDKNVCTSSSIKISKSCIFFMEQSIFNFYL